MTASPQRKKNQCGSTQCVLVCLLVALALLCGTLWAADTSAVLLKMTITNDKNQPVAAADVQVRSGDKVLATGITDANGKASIAVNGAGTFTIAIVKKGYIKEDTAVELAPGIATQDIEIVLAQAALSEQQVEVQATAESPVTEAAATPQATLKAEEVKQAAGKPATLADTLPYVPGVINTNRGVHIAGLGENHSTLLVNSVNVTDPATGSFGLTVPIDSLETIAVSEMPYLAQYGRFTAGVVTAETRRGGEKWNYSLNDPLPEFRIRSGHLQGLKTATPRFNASGPLIKDKLFLVEGVEYSIKKQQVYTLPFPENVTSAESINSFTQFDYIVSPTQTLTGSFHIAPHTLTNEGLSYFNPIPVTPNANYHPITATITDRLAVGGGLLQSIVAFTRISDSVSSKGTGDMVMSPVGNTGNYYSDEARRSNRVEWIENWTSKTLRRFGDHTLQFGTVLARSESVGKFLAKPVQIDDASGNLLRRIEFTGGKSFALSDIAPAGYAQDHWMLTQRFAVDLGMRIESQSITHTIRTAPRAGFVWTPDKSGRTVIRAGAGVFYDSVPLNVYAFDSYPTQTVTDYDGQGNIIGGPTSYINLTQTVSDKGFLFIDRSMRTGNFAPYSIAWNVEVERRINPMLTMRVKYLQSEDNGMITLQQEVFENQNALVLGSGGWAHTRQLEVIAQIGAKANRRFYFSYVRQHARGNLNDASGYLSDFPFPVVRSNLTASLPGEVPNRFLLWGTYSLPLKMRVSPKLECRNGLPWQPTDVYQNYVTSLTGPQNRFPRYFALDVRVSKDFQISPKHAIRLSTTVNNLTGHRNPIDVHSNTADPQYGNYFGNYERHFSFDFDFLF